jgi:hypothetical protein
VRAFIAGNNLTDQGWPGLLTSHAARMRDDRGMQGPVTGAVFITDLNGQFYEPRLPRTWSTGLTLRWK